MNPSRPRVPHGRELNHRTPAQSCAHRRSGAFAYRLRSLLPDDGSGTCAAGLAHPLGGAGGVLFRISLRSELGGHSAQDCAESLGFTASIIGVRHPRMMESGDVKVSGLKYAQI